MQTTSAKWWCKTVSTPCSNLCGSTRISRPRFRMLAPMFLRTQLLQISQSLRHRQLKKDQVAGRVSSRKNLSQRILLQIMKKWRSNNNFQIWQTSWSICLQYLDAHRRPMWTLTNHSRSSNPLKIIQILNKRHLVVQNHHRRNQQNDSRVTQTIFTDRPVNGTMLFRTKKFKNWWTPRARINLQLQIVIKMLLQKPSMANPAVWSLSSIIGTWAWSGRARGPVSASSPTSESSKKWMCFQAYIIWATPVSQIVWFSVWPTLGCSVSTADLANTARIASATLPNSNSWRRSMNFPSKNLNGYQSYNQLWTRVANSARFAFLSRTSRAFWRRKKMETCKSGQLVFIYFSNISGVELSNLASKVTRRSFFSASLTICNRHLSDICEKSHFHMKRSLLYRKCFRDSLSDR